MLIYVLQQFRRDTGYWAEFYTDPKRELYALMGCKTNNDIGKVSASRHVQSSVITGILKSAIRSASFPGELQGDQNQQGAAFILGPGKLFDIQKMIVEVFTDLVHPHIIC